uniref:Epidermal patterning factor-like protein n=1 Tax=Kalanchoe fedtschenkoi TaxID=63787 RepID=A0A7N0UCD1_KALFE
MGCRRRPYHAATALAFLLLAFASSALSFTQQPGKRANTRPLMSFYSSNPTDGRRVDQREPAAAAAADSRLVAGLSEEIERVIMRRLIGPGSSPPSCRSKCGRCAPCRPVHVPIQPGLTKPLEYYPEAWRCKCGNNLFMP